MVRASGPDVMPLTISTVVAVPNAVILSGVVLGPHSSQILLALVKSSARPKSLDVFVLDPIITEELMPRIAFGAWAKDFLRN